MKGFVPFPGDLLVGNYEPYKSTIVGIPHKGQGADVVREIYPWKYFSIDSLKSGVFPLWNPYTFSGTPHFANLQSSALYPANVLFFVLPFVDGWTIYIMSQYLLMLIFTYLFLREIKLGKLASIVGALGFSFSGFLTVWGWYGNLGHTIAYLPLVFFAIEKVLQKEKLRWYVLLITAISLSILAGYIQFVMYIYIVCMAYIIARYFASDRKNFKVYLFLVLSFGVAILVTAVQIFPLVELVRNSLRATYTYDVLRERLMPPVNIITLLAPDFFGNPAAGNYFLQGGSSLERASAIGVWPLIFAVYTIFSKRIFLKRFFGIAAISMYISTFSFAPIIFIHSLGIPLLSTGIPTRILSIFSFCLAVLAAIGIDAFMKDKKQTKMLYIIIVFGFVFACLWVVTFIISDSNILVSRRNLIIPSAIFALGSVVVFLKIPKSAKIVVVFLLTLSELFYSFQKFNSFVPKRYLYPETTIVKELQKTQGINRNWGYGNAYIDANFQLVDKNYSTEGYDALFSKRYGEFLSASENGKVPSVVPRSVANIYKGYGVNDLKQNPYRSRALDLTGVSLVLNKKGDPGVDSAFDEKKYHLTWEKEGWQIYKNIDVLPRVSLFGNYQKITDKNKLIKKLYDKNFNYKETVILEEDIAGFNFKKDKNAKARVVEYSPNEIELKTNSKYDQIVFLSDNYYPGWYATVDGISTQIYRANYTFRGVPVKAGEHTVIFTYSPVSFKIGLWVSIGSVTCLVLAAVLIKKYGKKQ